MRGECRWVYRDSVSSRPGSNSIKSDETGEISVCTVHCPASLGNSTHKSHPANLPIMHFLHLMLYPHWSCVSDPTYTQIIESSRLGVIAAPDISECKTGSTPPEKRERRDTVAKRELREDKLFWWGRHLFWTTRGDSVRESTRGGRVRGSKHPNTQAGWKAPAAWESGVFGEDTECSCLAQDAIDKCSSVATLPSHCKLSDEIWPQRRVGYR